MSYMEHKLLLPLGLTACLLVLLAAAFGMWKWENFASQDAGAATPALEVSDFSPIGLIGTVTKLGAGVVTIEGQPPGNLVPVQLEVLVDAQTSIINVGPAPAYATSTATYADLRVGMLLNIEASGVSTEGAVRHAKRIVIPPPAVAEQNNV